MQSQLDDLLLSEYIDTFAGYGNWHGSIWFVGLEEGSLGTVDEVDARLRAWNVRGKQPLEDLVDFHHHFGEGRWFGSGAKLQPTWKKLIRFYLLVTGRPTDNDTIRRVQRTAFARKDGDTCLLELLPLPSKSTKHWIYGGASQLSALRSREHYASTVLPTRIEYLQSKISAHCPKQVVFYSSDAHTRVIWKRIAGTPFEEADGIWVARRGETSYVIASHPTSFAGVSNAYWDRVADLATR